jgi:hypothetical protein
MKLGWSNVGRRARVTQNAPAADGGRYKTSYDLLYA